MTNGTENSRNFQISGKKDNRLSTYLILYRKFRLNRSRPKNLENTSCRNFDWSMETMVPWRSWQKGHEETPTTNLFACGQLAADHPCQGTFVTQCAVRTFNVSMAFWPRFQNFRSELTRKKIFLANVIRLQLSRKCAGRIGIHLFFDSMKELGH